MERKMLSFVIPCYRSEHTVEDVINEIIQVVNQRASEYDYEIIAVNDCSPDNVYHTLTHIAEQNSKVKVIDLALNGGKHVALMAGFANVSGDIVVGVDDDGQCPIEQLWNLLEPLKNGYDMAMAQYPQKTQTLLKNMGSKLNDYMVRSLIGKPKGLVFTNFIARKRFVCDEIIRYKNPYPYLEGLTLHTTKNIASVPMKERERQQGKSGYTLKKSIALWMNGCTAFSVKPLRIATVFGIFFSIIGFAMGVIFIILQFINTNIEHILVIAVMLFLGGIIMLLMGIMGEYIGRIYICINNSPQYVIREKINFDSILDK